MPPPDYHGKDCRHVISLVFPAYNPGPAIERTFAVARDFLRARPDPWEVLFVLDGCTDGTPDHLADLVANDPRFRVLSYTPNRGKGYAVRAGLLAARGRYRLFTDVDLAYGLDDIARIADELAGGAAVAIASRTHPESQIRLPVKMLRYAYLRKVQSGVFGWFARRLLPLAQRDTQAGLKGMTAAVAERVLPELACDGFGFDCEFLTACERLGIPVAEVPVCVRYEDSGSTTGLRTTLRMLNDLWRIRRAWAGRVVEPFDMPAAVPEPPGKAA
jgi:dolichyl-phosphate beta-glucosyltransferase